MNDNNFKKALSDSMKAECDELMPETNDVHTFSPEFDKKMNKLIRRRKKPFYRLINTTAKRVACVFVVLLTATSITALSSKSYRDRIKGFLIDTEKTHSTIRSEGTTNSPGTIKEIYGITYDLSGFTVKHEDYDEYDRHISYLNGNIQLNFDQHVKSTFDGDFNTEDAEIQEIEINGMIGMYFLDNNNYDHLIWDNGDYVFTMYSNIGKDELIKIAESVKIVESNKFPETVEDIYGITYDLSGYTIDKEDNTQLDRLTVYKNNDVYIFFGQHAKPEYDEDVNTEDAEIMEISINGHSGMYFRDNQNYNNIIWDNGDYVFTMYSNIGKDELIKIAKSVQKVETEK